MHTPVLMDKRFLPAVGTSAVAFSVLVRAFSLYCFLQPVDYLLPYALGLVPVHLCSELLTRQRKSINRLCLHRYHPLPLAIAHVLRGLGYLLR